MESDKQMQLNVLPMTARFEGILPLCSEYSYNILIPTVRGNK